MRRLMWLTAGVALAAVPALFGLTGNPALSHSVPVPVPSGAVPVTDTQINSGQVRHEVEKGSGSEGHGKGGHGATATTPVAGRGGHGAPAPPLVSGRHGEGTPHIATATPHVATPPHVSGKGRRHGTDDAAITPAPPASPTPGKGRRQGTDDAATTPAPPASPTLGKARVSPAAPDVTIAPPVAPDMRGDRPDPTISGGRGRNHGLVDGRNDGLGQGGGSGRKLPF